MHRPWIAPAAALLVSACGVETRPPSDTMAATPADTTPLAVAIHRVNTGPRGMAARVRWALSPDRRTLIVVEDPADVEAEPLPNGFLVASEAAGAIVQRDSAWDVAPSPEWTRVAYGRAHVLVSDNPGPVSAAQWRALARATGVPADSLRSASFDASGMTIARGIGRPVIVPIGGSADPVEQIAPALAGWRVGWPVGIDDALAVGTGPVGTQDAAPPERWLLVPIERGAVRPLPQGTRLYEPGWQEGPVLDVSIDLALDTLRVIPIENGAVRSVGGEIRRNGRLVGPGAALAATSRGRYIVALAPDPGAGEFEVPVRLVVYEVR